ncbi:hypothetical protein L873DRAFT_1664479, partial [Choiromyces venosus 120613-1]
AYHEEFKIILKEENKKTRQIGLTSQLLPIEWANYAFRNEISVEVRATFCTNLVWNKNGEKRHEECIGIKRKQHTSMMCWRMISWD